MSWKTCYSKKWPWHRLGFGSETFHHYECLDCGYENKDRKWCPNCSAKWAAEERQAKQHAHEKQMEEKRQEREKEQREHEACMLLMRGAQQNAANKAQSMESSISYCDTKIADMRETLAISRKRRETLFTEQKEAESELKKLCDKLDNHESSAETQLSNLRDTLGLDKLKSQLERCENEISGAIEKTCVGESNISRFLKLVQGLSISTMNKESEMGKLSSIMNTFKELIKREGDGRLSIEYYFGSECKNIPHIVPILRKEEFNDMEDIICMDGNENGEDFKEIMEIIDTGLQEAHKEWKEQKTAETETPLPEPKLKLSLRERRILKQACLKPETWQKYAKSKENALKLRLQVTAPVLITFFQRIFTAMEQVQAILAYNYNNNLDKTQQNAIQKLNDLKYLELEPNSNSDSKTDEKNEKDEKEEKTDTTVVTTDSTGQSPPSPQDTQLQTTDTTETTEATDSTEIAELNLAEIVQGLDGTPKKKLEESLQLRNAAIVSIDVVASMKDMFLNCGGKGATASGLASSVENSCMKIATAQSNVRESIVLAQEICKLKPSSMDMSEEAKNLWNAVDSGIIQIYDTAIKLNKASMDYFGFFLKFRQSFSYFLSCKDEALLVSMEYLRKDIETFNKYTSNFELQVASLSKNAMKCIKSCVEQGTGAETFEKAQKDREIVLKQYRKAKKEYDETETKLTSEYDKNFSKKIETEGKISLKKLLIESLDKEIEFDETILKSTEDTVKQLNIERSKAYVSDVTTMIVSSVE